MDIDEDIRDRIEHSFGDGPPLPHADVLLAGRSAVRRRHRVLVGAAAAAVLAVVGTTALANGRVEAGLGPAGPPVAGAPGASPTRAQAPTPTAGQTATPTAQPTTTPAPPSRAEISRALHQDIAGFDAAGRLQLVPGASVVQRLENPYRLTGGDTSLGLRVAYRGGIYWFALNWSADGSSGSAAIYSEDARPKSFDAWVQAQKPLPDSSNQDSTVGPDVWPGVARVDLVRFAGDTERLLPRAGVRILEQRAHVSVGGSFAGPNDHTAAASVLDAGGQRYYVLARSFDGKAGQYIAVQHHDGGPTLTAFLDLARSKYTQGGGGLL